VRAARRDDNEQSLLQVVRRVGGYWVKAPPLDGWVWSPRIQEWTPAEIKRPDKEGHKDEFTPAQKKLLEEFSDRRIRHFIWRTPSDVIRDLGGRS
jgi:hypothetical protein